MNKIWILVFVISITSLSIGLFFITGRKTSGNYDFFAKCLSEKGVTMYGSYWCNHCQNQKKIFGDSFKYINYVECTENQDLCREKGIEGYPTWIINDEKYPGEQSIQKLSQLTGCKILK